MKKMLRTFALFTACGSSLAHAQAGPDNFPPNISILWPHVGDSFRAGMLATEGETGPVELVVGTNSVGLFDQSGSFSATTPPVSVTVSNLLEGEYKLRALYLGGNSGYCRCNRTTNTIRVVQLGVR